jgi:hypothetical protein
VLQKQISEKILKRVEEEFRTEKMREVIRSVALEQTKSGLSDVIQRTVGDQVTEAIKAQTPKIQQTVIEETRKSVSGLAPTIDKAVKQAATEAEGRVQNRIAQWEDLIHVQTLAILARNGSGVAYDQLIAIANKTQNPAIREIGTTTQNQVFLEMSQVRFARHFIEKKSGQQLLDLLNDSSPLIREVAIDELVQLKNKSIVPKLLDMAEHDQYILVRRAAYDALRALTGQQIEPLDMKQWKEWWEKNKSTWPAK